MKTADRMLLAALVAGVWALVVLNILNQPAYALSIAASDIDGLEYYVNDIVEDCSVRGEVYVYEISGSEGYGELESARINC